MKNATRVILATLLGLLLSAPALAQNRNGRILELDEEIIEGRIEKPEAFYILQPTNLDYQQTDLQESFLPELLRTVESAPF